MFLLVLLQELLLWELPHLFSRLNLSPSSLSKLLCNFDADFCFRVFGAKPAQPGRMPLPNVDASPKSGPEAYVDEARI